MKTLTKGVFFFIKLCKKQKPIHISPFNQYNPIVIKIGSDIEKRE